MANGEYVAGSRPLDARTRAASNFESDAIGPYSSQLHTGLARTTLGTGGDARRDAERTDGPFEFQRTRTLLLIDDLRLRRECLFHLLSAELPELEVAAVASSSPFEKWLARSPDIILVTARGDERQKIGEIVAASKSVPVLLLVESESDEDWRTANEPAVAGRFPTAHGSALLIAAIQLVLAGGRFQIPVPSAAPRREKGANG